MANETQKVWSIYKITNLINGKIYIGQTIEPKKRWYQHRRDAATPKYPLHFSINKNGAHNFNFEIVLSCRSQDDANWAEEELIKQYDSLVKNGKGYNISLGGMAAPKSDEWKQAIRDWWKHLSLEEKNIINQKRSNSFTKYIKENGHIAQGTKRTDVQRANMSIVQKSLDKEAIYTEEVRRHMSDAHIGIKDSEETKQKKSEKAKIAWDKRNAERFASGEIKCYAPGCEIFGKAKYKIVNGVRYCNKHGLRMLRNGTLDVTREGSDYYCRFVLVETAE